MSDCKHYRQQRGRGQEAIHWVCSDCGATITVKDWKDEQARLVAEQSGLKFYASPGVTPPCGMDVSDQPGPESGA